MSSPNDYASYGWILVIAIVFAVTLGQHAWQRRKVAGALAFVGMMVIGTLWILTGALQLISVEFAAKVFWDRAQNVLALTAVIISLGFALQYAGLGKWLNRPVQTLLVTSLAAYLLLELTNRTHHWIWRDAWLETRTAMHFASGPAGYIFLGYGYLLVLLTWTILIWLFIRSPRHRGPVGMVLIAQITTRIAFAFHFSYRSAVSAFDPLIPLVMIGYIAYFLALFRFNGFELVPAARGVAVTRMCDGVLVLDDRNRVIDLNPAAEALLDVRAAEIIGQDAVEYWATLPALVEMIGAPLVGHTEIVLGAAGANQRFLDITASPLSYAENRQRGQLLLVRDMTEHRQNDAALHQAYAELEQRVAERTQELQQANAALSRENADRQRAEMALRSLNATLETRVADRTRELTTLYTISAAAARTEDLDRFLEEALEMIVAALRSEVGAIMLQAEDADQAKTNRLQLAAQHGAQLIQASRREITHLDEGLYAAVAASRQPLLIPDITADPRVPTAMQQASPQTLLLVPFEDDGRVLGLAGVMRDAELGFTGEEVALLTTIADQIAVIVRSHHLRQEAQQARLLAERQRVARDLHNSVTQSLYGLVAFAEAGQSQLEGGDLHGARHSLDRIGETTRQALREMRLFIHQLRPDVLEQEGLVGALQLRLAAVEGRADLHVSLCADEVPRFPPPVESALYQVAQEALNNVLRHACASSVTVTLRCETRRVALEVTDDGCGLDPSRVTNAGMGLNNMHEAVSEVGGTLEILSAPNQGTTVRAIVPIKE